MVPGRTRVQRSIPCVLLADVCCHGVGFDRHEVREVERFSPGPRCAIPVQPSLERRNFAGLSFGTRSVDIDDCPPIPETKSIVVWISIDPLTGNLACYPADCASRIEETFANGLPSVSLKGFGGFYETASVDLQRTRSGRPEQRSRGGRRRDVRRFVLLSGTREITAHAVQQGGWKMADEPIPGVTSLKRIELTGYEDVPIAAVTRVGSTSATAAAQFIEARAQACTEGDEAGHVGVWEWCRCGRPPTVSEVPEDMWGLYEESHNETIETAFRAGKPNCKIVIGIRTYEIVFEGPTYARQVDHAMRKGRHVRRTLLPAAKRDEKFRLASAEAISNMSPGLGNEECAICCCPFVESPLVDTVRLSECGHFFHRPCIQSCADKKAACPLCRTNIDWSAALALTPSR